MLQRKLRFGGVHALRAILRFVGGQQLEDLLRRSRAVHGDVEVTAQQTQRQEEICRQQDDGQRRRQGNLPLCERRHRADDAQTCTAVGHQVHQGHRVQLHGQHLHGDLAEALGLFVHLFVLPAVGLIDLQRGQALNVFQKAVAEGGVLAPILVQQLLGKFLHGHNGHRDEGHTAQQDDGRPRVDAHQQDEQRHGGQQAVKQLGQILCEVGVDLLHALAGQHDHFAGGHRLTIARTKAGQLFVDAAAQGALDVLRRAVAHAGRAEGQAIPHRHSDDADEQSLFESRRGQRSGEHIADEVGHDGDEHHIAEHPQPLEQDVQPHIAQRAPVKGQ